MKSVYTRTLRVSDLTKATVKLEIYSKNKHLENCIKTREFKGIRSWTLYSRRDALDLEKARNMKPEQCDIRHEYLELERLDGTKEYYNNTAVSLWIW